MNILQRIRFSPSPPAQSLYSRNHNGLCSQKKTLHVKPGTTIELDSFFNSFVVGPNGWPSEIGPVTCELRIQGDMEASLIQRDLDGQEDKIKIFQEGEQGVVQCTFDTSNMWPCRLFVRIRAGDAGATILGGSFFRDARMDHISLAVVFCTYLREADLLRNVQNLCDDEDLMGLGVRVYVADNGQSITPEDLPAGVVLLPGPNEGGAGGFNRGIREAVQQGASHLVLMDDDVTFDSEAVFRCCSYFRFLPRGAAIAGVLLDDSSPEIVQEAGAWVSGATSPFTVRVGNNQLSIAEPSGLDALYSTPEPEYGGFWLFAFPVEALHATGLIAPVFLKADDIEFCLRLKQHGAALQLLAGVGVQHPGFTTDFSILKRYYWIRNMLMVEALHGARTGFHVAFAVAREAVREWRLRRLHFAAPLMLGVEDFLKGPILLESFDNARMVSSLNALYKILQPKEHEERMSHMRAGWYALRGLFASAKLAVRFSELKKQWHNWASST